MKARKFGRFVPRVFQKGIVHGVIVDLSDEVLPGGFNTTNGVKFCM